MTKTNHKTSVRRPKYVNISNMIANRPDDMDNLINNAALIGNWNYDYNHNHCNHSDNCNSGYNHDTVGQYHSGGYHDSVYYMDVEANHNSGGWDGGGSWD
jgi:hypothetical protein